MNELDGDYEESPSENGKVGKAKPFHFPSINSNPQRSLKNVGVPTKQEGEFPGTAKFANRASSVVISESKPHSSVEIRDKEKNIKAENHKVRSSDLGNIKTFKEDAKINRNESSGNHKSTSSPLNKTQMPTETIENHPQNSLNSMNTFGKPLPLPFKNPEKKQPATVNFLSTPFSESVVGKNNLPKIAASLTNKVTVSPTFQSSENKDPSPVNLSKSQNTIENLRTVNLEESNNTNMKNLITLLSKSTDLQKIHSNESFLKMLNLKSNQSLSCRKCKSFFIAIKTECGHYNCLSCYRLSIQALLENPNFSTYSKCACSICGTTGSTDFLTRVFPERSSELLKLSINRNCVWCKRELDLFQQYFPNELKCKHLCDICYLNEVFFNSKLCLCCKSPFKNLDFTLKRSATCVTCEKSGLFVENGYRMTSSKQVFCLKCIERQLTGIIKTSMKDRESIILKNLVNVKCPKCKLVINVEDIVKCPTCQSFCCELCDSNSKKCLC